MGDLSSHDRWIRLAGLAAALLYLALAVSILLGAVSRIGEPYSGLLVSHKGYVGLKLLAASDLDLSRTPIDYADRLVSLDGEPLSTTAELNQRLADLGIGQLVRYGFVRPDGSRFEIVAPVVRVKDRMIWSGVIPIMLAGIAGMLCALVILLAQPRNRAARVFFVATWGCTLQFMILPFDTFWLHRLLPWSQLGGAIAFGGLLHLGLSFPETRWPLTRMPKIGIVAIYGAASVPWLWAIARHDLPNASIDTYGRGLYVPALTVLSLPVAANAIWSVLRSSKTDQRKRARLAMPIVLLIASTSVIHRVWNMPMIPLELRIAICVLFTTVVAATFVFVAVRSDTFEIPPGQRQTVVRTLSAGLGLLAYLGLHAGVQRWAGMASAWATGVVAALLLLGLLITLQPLRGRFEKRVEDLLFPGHRGSREAIRDMARELAQTRIPSEIAPLVRAAIGRGVGAAGSRVLMTGSDTGLDEIGCPDWVRRLSPRSIRAAETVFETRCSQHLGQLDDSVARTVRTAAKILWTEGFAYAIALPKGSALGGFLIEVQSDLGLLGDSSIDVLETLADQSAVALENARAWEENQILQRRLSEQNLYLKQELKENHGFNDLVGDSAALKRVLANVEQVAGTSATVLITGETGTGKELIARAIHAGSARAEGLLVKLACGAIPESLFESELFGHEKGAFTGADKRRIGRFEVAEGGTLFFDDVDVLPLPIQAKLLRAIQEGEIQRLGSNDVRIVDARIIAATNKKLEDEVRAGRFREDLYYRLNVVPISVPPLRDRPEDIPALVQHFVAVEAAKHGRDVDGMSWAALEEMRCYAWPGNIRELRNVVERAVVLSQERTLRLAGPLEPGSSLTEPDLGGDESQLENGEVQTLEERVRRFKRQLIRRVLAEVDGNHRLAAEKLGIRRPSLTRLVSKLGIQARGEVDRD